MFCLRDKTRTFYIFEPAKVVLDVDDKTLTAVSSFDHLRGSQ